ncbi:WYL domain-containing protein [bacterium]|nr:WYL domain-containing protein [bacterium]
MKEFLKSNTVTYNLMSFTAFKSILVFSLLLEGPKSYKEIQDFLQNHEYLQETVSIDTIRIYINSLREFGCNITSKRQNGIAQYYIESHPFALKFDDAQIKNIIKVFKAISKSIDVDDLMALQKFFVKIADYVENEDLKTKLQNISPLSNIDSELLKNLLNYVRNNNEITIYYNSPNSGKKNITVLADKLHIDNGKLYLSGFNSEYNNYSSFQVSRIIKIVGVNIERKIISVPEITVGYEYMKDGSEELELLSCEKVIKDEDNKLTIEMTSRNKFEIMQRIMFHASKCKVLYPEDFRNYIVSNLKKMKEEYIERS